MAHSLFNGQQRGVEAPRGRNPGNTGAMVEQWLHLVSVYKTSEKFKYYIAVPLDVAILFFHFPLKKGCPLKASLSSLIKSEGQCFFYNRPVLKWREAIFLVYPLSFQ